MYLCSLLNLIVDRIKIFKNEKDYNDFVRSCNDPVRGLSAEIRDNQTN